MADQQEQFDHCKHPRAQAVRWKQTNGVVRAGECCLDCGHTIRNIPVRSVNLASLPWLEREALRKAYYARMTEFYEERRQVFIREQEEREAAWKQLYYEHVTLMSPKWKQLRRKVFARSKGLCEGCGEIGAAQVHHLTYDRLGDEMLFDLVAVCMDCHEKIHGRPIGDSA